MNKEKYQTYYMKTVDTFTATIYVGFKNRETGQTYNINGVYKICQEYVDDVGLCVNIMQTDYIYTGGHEHGAAITLINYPRFPEKARVIKTQALDIAKKLLKHYRQQRISIVCSDETIMVINGDRVKDTDEIDIDEVDHDVKKEIEQENNICGCANERNRSCQ